MKTITMLSEFQIITRYCEIEEPYARAFLKYYKNKGLQLLHVIVQSEKEKEDIENLCKETNIEAKVALQPGNITPDQSLQRFEKSNLNYDLPLCMMVDMDEYIHAKVSDETGWSGKILAELRQQKNESLKIFWHMNICDKLSDPTPSRCGFKGHQGKQIILTRDMIEDQEFNGIKGAHTLIRRNQTRLKSAMLVHIWSRSFQDSLLKVFFSRMKSFKTEDQPVAKELIHQGKIPNRLINLAFLACQEQITKSPDFISGLNFDHISADRMLHNYIGDDTINKCYSNYKKYVSLLQEYLHEYRPEYYPYPNGKPKDLREIGKLISQLNLI